MIRISGHVNLLSSIGDAGLSGRRRVRKDLVYNRFSLYSDPSQSTHCDLVIQVQTEISQTGLDSPRFLYQYHTCEYKHMRPRSAKGAATKDKIIRTAADLFHERGVGTTSPDDIIEASKTGKGQFYHYFKSKEGLVHEVLPFYGRQLCRTVVFLVQKDTPA